MDGGLGALKTAFLWLSRETTDKVSGFHLYMIHPGCPWIPPTGGPLFRTEITLWCFMVVAFMRLCYRFFCKKPWKCCIFITQNQISYYYMKLICALIPKTHIFIPYNSTLTRCKCKYGEGFSRWSDGGDERSPFGEILGEEGDSGEEGEAVAKACKQRGKRGHDSHWPAGLEHCWLGGWFKIKVSGNSFVKGRKIQFCYSRCWKTKSM